MEAEIFRLGEECGRSRNVDAMALQHRCDGQEGLILQLTEQVCRHCFINVLLATMFQDKSPHQPI